MHPQKYSHKNPFSLSFPLFVSPLLLCQKKKKKIMNFSPFLLLFLLPLLSTAQEECAPPLSPSPFLHPHPSEVGQQVAFVLDTTLPSLSSVLSSLSPYLLQFGVGKEVVESLGVIGEKCDDLFTCEAGYREMALKSVLPIICQVAPHNEALYDPLVSLLRMSFFVHISERSFLEHLYKTCAGPSEGAERVREEIKNHSAGKEYIEAFNTAHNAKRWDLAHDFLKRGVAKDPYSLALINQAAYIGRHMFDTEMYTDSLRKLYHMFILERSASNVVTPLHPFVSLILPLPPSLRIRAAWEQNTALSATITNEKGIKSKTFDIQEVSDRYSKRGRLRVGFVSADFSQKATMYLSSDHFQYFDRKLLDVYIISVKDDENSEWRNQVRDSVENFIYLPPSDPQAAVKKITELELDIFVNMDGYSNNGLRLDEINAFRHAPIQISWFVYIGTLGNDNYDYIVTDPIATPLEHAHQYSEKFLYLPHSFFPMNMKEKFPLPHLLPAGEPDFKVPTREDVGLDPDAFVFVCFNKIMKIDPSLFTSWLRILQRTPNSVLWLLSSPQDAIPHVMEYAAKYGLADRIIMAPFVMTASENYVRLRLADVALDTTIWGGHTTSADAIWSGLPLVSCMGACLQDHRSPSDPNTVSIFDPPSLTPLLHDEYGDTIGSRVTGSLLTSMGIKETLARTRAEYENIAVRLYEDQELLHSIKWKLMQSRAFSPIFDAQRYVRDLERGFYAVWDNYLEGKPADHIGPLDSVRVEEKN